MKEFAAKSVPHTEINPLVLRFLSPELRQSRQQTCRFAANSSSRAEGREGMVRVWDRIDLRALASVIHHRDYFETAAVTRGHTVKELFPNSTFEACPHARGQWREGGGG